MANRIVDSLLRLKLLGLEADKILDIGSCFGRWTNIVQEFVYPHADYTLIDAIDYNFDNVIVAVLAEKKKDVLWYELQNTGDSVFKENTPYFKDCEPVVKQAVTLDSLKLGPFDIIKIDTQGSELPILQGGRKTIKDTSIIILEIPFIGEYNEGVTDFFNHIWYMDSIGFIPYDISEEHRFNDILVQIDIIFIRKTHFILPKIQDIINNLNI